MAWADREVHPPLRGSRRDNLQRIFRCGEELFICVLSNELIETMSFLHRHALAICVQRSGSLKVQHGFGWRQWIVHLHSFWRLSCHEISMKIDYGLIACNEWHSSAVINQDDLEPSAVKEKTCACCESYHLMKEVPNASNVVERSWMCRNDLPWAFGSRELQHECVEEFSGLLVIIIKGHFSLQLRCEVGLEGIFNARVIILGCVGDFQIQFTNVLRDCLALHFKRRVQQQQIASGDMRQSERVEKSPIGFRTICEPFRYFG